MQLSRQILHQLQLNHTDVYEMTQLLLMKEACLFHVTAKKSTLERDFILIQIKLRNLFQLKKDFKWTRVEPKKFNLQMENFFAIKNVTIKNVITCYNSNIWHGSRCVRLSWYVRLKSSPDNFQWHILVCDQLVQTHSLRSAIIRV